MKIGSSNIFYEQSLDHHVGIRLYSVDRFIASNFHGSQFSHLGKIRPPLFFKVSKLDQNLHFLSNDHFISNKREHKSVICGV